MIKVYNEILKVSGKIFFVIVLFLFAGHASLAQVKSLQKDTLMVKLKKTESTGNAKEQNIKEFNNKQARKQIKGARPDMSKSRGARPPDIVRPAGSRIPQGLGRPGGAVRPGRR